MGPQRSALMIALLPFVGFCFGKLLWSSRSLLANRQLRIFRWPQALVATARVWQHLSGRIVGMHFHESFNCSFLQLQRFTEAEHSKSASPLEQDLGRQATQRQQRNTQPCSKEESPTSIFLIFSPCPPTFQLSDVNTQAQSFRTTSRPALPSETVERTEGPGRTLVALR